MPRRDLSGVRVRSIASVLALLPEISALSDHDRKGGHLPHEYRRGRRHLLFVGKGRVALSVESGQGPAAEEAIFQPRFRKFPAVVFGTGVAQRLGAVAFTVVSLLCPGVRAEEKAVSGCPAEMVRVRDVCVDRWEAAMVDRVSGRALSPYYPPHPRLLREVFRAWELERPLMGDASAQAMPLPALPAWMKTESFEPMAVSRPNQVPQTYVSYSIAKRSCENAGKRLCTHDEWMLACRGEKGTKFPYGPVFDRASCNVWGYIHPAFVLHDNSSVGHRDPRLNLLARGGDQPLLRRTGITVTCASRWGTDAIFDMVGNIDEWVDDETGRFAGGFYARSTSSGCESQVASHSPLYYDYSIGVRCCKTP